MSEAVIAADFDGPPPLGGLTTEGQLIYAVGDIHGRYDLLKGALAQIAADSAREAMGRLPMLVMLGDYVDRGPDSAKVLQALVWLCAPISVGVAIKVWNALRVEMSLEEQKRLVLEARLDQVAANPAVEAEVDEGCERPDFFLLDKAANHAGDQTKCDVEWQG